jgi:hypothetical protein
MACRRDGVEIRAKSRGWPKGLKRVGVPKKGNDVTVYVASTLMGA